MPFKKVSRDQKNLNLEIKGVRTSPNLLVKCVSSGVPSIDTFLLGGGLPVGFILGIISDQPRIYSLILQKFFAAEGIEAENVIFIAGKGAKKFPDEIPTSTDQQDKASMQDTQSQEKLKIAW